MWGWGNEEMRKCGNEEIITSFPPFPISEANSIHIRISFVKSGRSGPADRVREIESTEPPWDEIAHPGTGVFPRDGRGNLIAIEGILKI